MAQTTAAKGQLTTTASKTPVLPAPFDGLTEELVTAARSVLGAAVSGIGLAISPGAAPVTLAGELDGTLHRLDIGFPGLRAELVVVGPGALDQAIAEPLINHWRLLTKLCQRSSELMAMTSAMVETNDQLLSLYDLAGSWASSLQPEELGTFVVQVVVRITRSDAALLRDSSGRYHFFGEPSLEDFLRSAANRAGRESQLFRAGDMGLPSDVAVHHLDGQAEDQNGDQDVEEAGATLAVAAPSNRRLTTPHRKLIDAVASHVGGLLALSGFHQTQVELAVVQRDIETAGLLSDQAMPKWTPEVEGIEIAARSDFARLASGDFYTYVETDYGLMAAVGDVSGKGLPAALVMTMVSSATKAAALRLNAPDPLAVLNSVSQDVYDYLSEAGVFVTMAVVAWDMTESLLVVANAGHSPVMLRNAHGMRPIPAADPPLGILPELTGLPEVLELEPGDVLLLGSDGLAEQENQEGVQLGYAGVERALVAAADGSASDIVAAMFAEVEHHGEGVAQDDDRTALVVKRLQSPSERSDGGR